MHAIFLFLRSKNIFVLVLIIPILLIGCINDKSNNISPEIKRLPEINLRTAKDIKVFITLNIIRDIHIHMKNKPIIIRFINESDFSNIKELLSQKGISFEHGSRNVLGNIEPVSAVPREDDGLNYSPEYIYEHGITCLQIENFSINKNTDHLKIKVETFRAGMDASGYSYFFYKKGDIWIFHKKTLNWIS